MSRRISTQGRGPCADRQHRICRYGTAGGLPLPTRVSRCYDALQVREKGGGRALLGFLSPFWGGQQESTMPQTLPLQRGSLLSWAAQSLPQPVPPPRADFLPVGLEWPSLLCRLAKEGSAWWPGYLHTRLFPKFTNSIMTLKSRISITHRHIWKEKYELTG